jgi:hypothetical protein
MHTTGHWIVTLIIIIIIIIVGFVIWGKGASQKNFAEQQGGPNVGQRSDPWNEIKNNGNWMMVFGAILVVGGFIGLINVGLHAYREGMFDGMGGGYRPRRRSSRYY